MSNHQFANTIALLQVAIALGAMAALGRAPWIWYASLFLGTVATALFVMTLLR
ncbi:MAG: hypothetical protein NVSMB68_05050 [Thermoanaerobaculia bacterium]